MKKLTVVFMVAIFFLGCTSTKPIDTQSCIKVANTVENNEAKSGDELYKACLDKQYQKNESKKGFWEKLSEGVIFFILDVVSS